MLVHEGREYASKAIVAVAYRYATGRALATSEFSRGAATMDRVLRRPRFTVRAPQNPTLDLTALMEMRQQGIPARAPCAHSAGEAVSG